jgi:hypothetical protein
MLHAMGCLRENLGRNHHILVLLEKELEKQGQLTNQDGID